MERFIGFLVVVGIAVWFFAKNPCFLLPVLAIAGILLGIIIVLGIAWYGLVQIRIWLKI